MSQQTSADKQAKFSQSKLDEIYRDLCLYEYNIEKEEKYDI